MTSFTLAPFDLDLAVAEYYQPLLRFAASLAGNAADAADLAQQTFYLAQTRGHQLRDPRHLKTWLFTTLRREFLQRRRHETRFPKFDLAGVARELPGQHDDHPARLDAQAAVMALAALPSAFRVPLELFYLEDKSYAEIARAIHRPIGTVMSRLARGRQQLRARLEHGRGGSRFLLPARARFNKPVLALAA
jgi:RNA polymerase sigma-70 factor (ECF subfamily)